jgi:hypothetical protein
VTTTHRKPRKNAFRRWFATLHPSLQLVLLQLWMPLFFIVMFCVCYVAAFHAPAPHDVPVGVIGSSQSMSTLESGIGKALRGTIVFTNYGNATSAEHAVIRGTAASAYDPATHVLYVAGAHQFQASSLMQRMLVPVLSAEGTVPTVKDLAPLPAHDAFGMTSMYLMLAWCIGGYMTAMFIGLMGAPLMHRTRLAVIVGLGLAISIVTNILVGPVIGAIDGHFWPLVLMSWGWVVAIGLAVNGLSYFFGRFIALPAMVVFVFLSIPSSGAAYPPWMMPEPFAWLNNVVVGSGITEMIKHAVYGVGPGYARGLIMMACYALAGLLLMLAGKPYWEARRVRRVVAGKTTMFIDAQNANRDFLAHQRDRILAKHGLESTLTGTIRTVSIDDDDERELAKKAFEDEVDSRNTFFGPPSGLEDQDVPMHPPGRGRADREG